MDRVRREDDEDRVVLRRQQGLCLLSKGPEAITSAGAWEGRKTLCDKVVDETACRETCSRQEEEHEYGCF